MSTNRTVTRGRFQILAMAAALTLASAQTQAAPGPLSQVPLFLAQGVQPNIFFLLDDSGSMDWEVLRRENGDDGSQYLDFTPDNDAERWELCVGYNVLAYDPRLTYTPWTGEDVNGDAFQDQTSTAARVNPYTGSGNAATDCSNNGRIDNTNGRVCNLETGFGGNGAFYYPWTDADDDKLYDANECPTDNASRVYVSTMSATEKVNFANWFSYYRKREYVMKRAVSQIISESRDRLGLATINKNNHVTKGTEVGTQVKDVDDLTLPINDQAVVDKATLLDNLLGVNSNSRTPLRLNLQYVGEYFRNDLSTYYDEADKVTRYQLFGVEPNELTDDPDSAAGYSPILKADLGGTCQQNFVVLLSDGFWNGDNPTVGNEDADNAANPFDGQSYADAVQNTLADVAMNLYKGDLLDVLADEVPAVAIPRGSDPDVACYDAADNKTQECFDTNNAQHLVTFTVSFGLTGRIPLTDATGNACIPGNRTQSVVDQGWPSSCGASFNGWPTPVSDQNTTADDMQHAAWNGRGLYLPAKYPDELISRLRQAIGNISARKPAAAAAVAVDTFNVINGGNLYQGRFDAGNWTGELYAREMTGTTVGAELWAAHTLLNSMDINTRILVTYNGSQGTAFTFPADYNNLGTGDLSQAQINDLLYNAPHAIATADATEISDNKAYGESLVAYLRGSAANEGSSVTSFRQRYGHRLGDIIHASPVYVGNPDPELYPSTISPASDSYQAWANNSISDGTNPGANGRQEMIYVGANDGALHAFRADTGAEVFAYYPEAVFSSEERLGLHWLANPAYEHRYYVDIEPAVGEAYVDTGDLDGLTWRTLLVGGLRGGGRAIYALDVSDPTEFADATSVAGNVLWEFTHPDLGYTYSKPTIAKLNDGRWAAIFGNGYNPAGATATGKAALFIKYLDTADPPYRVLYTDVGTIANGSCLDAGSDCNGLGTPAVVDLGADRVADRVYAGDLKGNIWVFDLSSTTAADWKSAYGTLADPEPLFSAYYLDANGARQPQPITTQPMVTLHPTERHDATRPNTMVFFGTGQYMVENDPITKGGNSFYGIWDSGAPLAFDRSATDPVLVKQTITPDTLGDKEVRLLSNNPVNYESHKGWFIDLPDEGERVIVTPIVFADLVIYTTMVPFSNLCSDSAGYSWLMVHNLADGSEPDFIALDVTGDGSFDGDDQIGDSNVAGVKSGNLYWQPTMVKSGPGAIGTLLLPTDSETGLTQEQIQGAINKGTRSSWGIFRYED